MHVHAVTRVHAVTPKLVICVMYLTSIWRILLMTDGLKAVWSNDRAAHTDTNPKNLELAPPQSITATRLDQLVYSPNYYIQIFQTQNNCPQWEANLHPARSESWAFATTPRELQYTIYIGYWTKTLLLLYAPYNYNGECLNELCYISAVTVRLLPNYFKWVIINVVL